MKNILVSIITVSFNSKNTIKDTINSVLNQTYPNIEYIIIDGGSSDGTVDIASIYKKDIVQFISEKDDGIYDAMNKGINLATGNIIGFLNSDDTFYDNTVIKKIVDVIENENKDAVFGDVQFIDPKRNNKVVRYYSSRYFTPDKFKFGIMPAHPSFYIKSEILKGSGGFNTNYKIASDFELLVRLMNNTGLDYKYLAIPFVKMKIGGISNKSMKSNFIINKEIKLACKENKIKTNYFIIYMKYFIKVFELLRC